MYSRTFGNELEDYAIEWVDYKEVTPLADILDLHPDNLLLAVTDPEIVVPKRALSMLAAANCAGAMAWGPVFNLTPFAEQMAALPASYLNMTSLLEIADLLALQFDASCSPVDVLDCACLMIRPQAFSGMNPNQPFGESVSSLCQRTDLSFAALRGALVHRFGDYYGAERLDLVERVSPSARRVLDIGCAQGGYGRTLKKKRPDIHVSGVELNPVMAARAKLFYDQVHTCRVEEIRLARKFDHINCGDVLEHLQDPPGLLKRLREFLTPGGCLVASVPNVGHWSVAKDLLQGKFEYLPVGLLCTTHMRWFTERSLIAMFADCGYVIRDLHREKIAPTPEGERFIRRICRSGWGDEASLRTNEFIITATINDP